MEPHPAGVQPLGNCYASCGAAGVAEAVAAGRSGDPVRRSGLGALAVLPDELLLALLAALPPAALAALCTASRACYAFGTHEELWRHATLRDFGGDVRFTRTWRDTYRRRVAGAEPPPGAPDERAPARDAVRAAGLCSDVLFQPHLCAATPLRPEWLSVETVPRCAGLSPAEFVERFEKPNQPCILTDVVSSWPAAALWDAAYLEERHGGATVYAGGYPFALRDYLRYARSVTRDDAPLYLFDREVLGATQLGEQFAPPPHFGGDYFGVLGGARPAYRWLIVGPPRSGSTWHIDPNGTSAWNGVLRGAKKWLLCPPGAPPPGVAASADGAHVTCPLALTEWLLSFYDAARALPPSRQPRECVCAAGELLFVPAGWWHMALNVGKDITVALTQNYVSDANLPGVLTQLATCSESLVSGCAPGERAALHGRFVAAMEAAHPAALAAARRAVDAAAAAAAARWARAALCSTEGARTFAFNFAKPTAADDQGDDAKAA